MEKMDLVWTGKVIVSFVAAVSGYLFGGWPYILGALLFFVLVDYISGMVAAGIEGKLASRIGYIGIAKKVMIFVFVAIGHLSDAILGSETVLRDTVIIFYLANEFLSIAENAGRIGLPVPKALRQAIEVLKGKGGGLSQ